MPTHPVSRIAKSSWRASRVLPFSVFALVLNADSAVAAARQWTGVNGTFWSDETNWEPPAAPRFNGRFNDSILVNGSSELVYDSSLGETFFGSNMEAGLKIGTGMVREPGTLIVTGGRLSSAGSPREPDQIGTHGGQFLIKGGVYESGPAGLVVGVASGKGARLELAGGLARVPRVEVDLQAGVLHLKGGVLETQGIALTGVVPVKTEPRALRLDGGVIRTTGEVTSLFAAPEGMAQVAQIHGSGVTFDIGKGKVVVRGGLQSAVGPAEAPRDGGFIKEGEGDLFFVAPSSFNGDITINGGGVRATKGNNVPNPVETTLGNAQFPGRQIYINNGGVLCLGSNDIFGSTRSDVKTAITINAGGVLTNQHRSVNHAFGFINRLGPLRLNGGTVLTEGGANPRFQSYSLGGSVTVGGTTASRITATTAPQAKNLGYHLGKATGFDVADATRSPAGDLIITAQLIDQPPPGPAAPPAPGGLVKHGPGTLLLGEANLHTGVTEVKAGEIVLGHALALQFSPVDVQAPGRLVLDGQGRTFWLGGLRKRGDQTAEIVANGNRVSLAPAAVSEFAVEMTPASTGLLRVIGGELALDGRLVLRMRTILPAGTHVFPLLTANSLSGAFREIAVTGSYIAEGTGTAPVVDTAGNSFVFDAVRGELTVKINR